MQWRCAMGTAVLLAAWVTVAGAQDIKIGYVNLQRALNESSEGKRAKEKFKKEVDRFQASLEDQKQELETLKEQLEKKAVVMKEEERRNLEREYQRKLRDFERAYKDSQGELQMRDNELTAQILAEIQKVIQEVGKREGYTLILESSSAPVLYGDSDADITERVIDAYNDR